MADRHIINQIGFGNSIHYLTVVRQLACLPDLIVASLRAEKPNQQIKVAHVLNSKAGASYVNRCALNRQLHHLSATVTGKEASIC